MAGLVVFWSPRSKEEMKRLMRLLWLTIVQSIFGQTETDVGFSVVARVRLSGADDLDLTVEGPEQHPASGLVYMFNDVFRTGIWKPTACPHCAMNVPMQRGKTSLVSDGEDSDSVPAVPRLGSSQNSARRGLSNIGGVYHGNANGNWNEGNTFSSVHFNWI